MNFLNLISGTNHMLDFKLSTPTALTLSRGYQTIESSAFRKVSGTQSIPPSNDPSCLSPSIDAILQQRQRLINQYLQLNIQMLQKQIQGHPPSNFSSNFVTASPQEILPNQSQCRHKKIKKPTHCGHDDRPHYAKGMCSNCYHRYGRMKKPWKCTHEKLYAAGLCQNCYINEYNRKRREEGKCEDIKTPPTKDIQMAKEAHFIQNQAEKCENTTYPNPHQDHPTIQ